ncbi:MAG: pantoate--beta-alanine ligase, partial [Bacteroidota bacterium]|nr:pantoate--beta-alanine ligase [Bacteroidota bacterium]
LFEAKKIGKNKNVKNLKEFVVDTINDNKYLEVEYFEIVDDIYINEIKSWNEKNKKIGCVAVHCGKIRLIDNIYLD